MKKRKGVAMVYVVCVFFILSAFTTIMFSYFSNNLRMSVQQQENMRAYYYTSAGIELGTAALYTDRPILVGGVPTGDTCNLFEDFLNNNVPGAHLEDVVKFYQIDGDDTSPLVAEVTITIDGDDSSGEMRVILDVATELYLDNGSRIARNAARTSFLASNPATKAREAHN